MSSVSIPDEYRSELSGLSDLSNEDSNGIDFYRKKLTIRKPILLGSGQKGTTNDTDKQSTPESETLYKKPRTEFMEFSKKLREETTHEYANNPMFTSAALERMY
jgi:hypothetical protein